MFLSLFLTFFVAVGIGTVFLVALGHRTHFSSRVLGIVGGVLLALASGELAGRAWHLDAQSVLTAQTLLASTVLAVSLARPKWNLFGQAFFGAFLAAAGTYLVFASYITFDGGLPAIGLAASVVLLLLETLALLLAGYFVFEGCDVICRTKPTRPAPQFDPSYQPKVSLQIPAYNEPPDMLIETIQSVEGIDYPNLEIIVIDNNTTDEALWRPVEDYCRDRPRVRFIHEEGLDGFKAGALNFLEREGHIARDVELIGVIDADYRVDPNFLKELVGHFVDQQVAFVQAPQDYREWEGDAYMTACYDSLRYFFATSMPGRNERNSIIFAGTMGLIRRSALAEVGGWPEWCITEDSETSFRLLKRGYEGIYVNKVFGQGIMPLTFTAFKQQRFRWAFGGIQILKKHWFSMLPFPRTRNNRLTFGQRVDYMVSGMLWFNDLLYLGFGLVLLATAIVVMSNGSIELRPLKGAVILLPAALIASGVVRALWSLRVRTHIGLKRSILAFMSWLSLSWTVALACLQHFFRSRAAFLRTPKEGKERTLRAALSAARAETTIAVILWAAPVVLALSHRGSPFLYGLFIWQGFVYASGPIMSYLNVKSELSERLERRRLTEYLRARGTALVPYYAGAVVLVAVVVGLFTVGGQEAPTRGAQDLFSPPRRSTSEESPLRFLGNRLSGVTPAPSAQPPATVAPATQAPVVTDAPLPTPTSTQPPPPPTATPVEPTPVTTAAPAADGGG